MSRYQAILLPGLLLALAATGCGRQQKLELGPFAPYVTHFEARALENGEELHVTDLVVKFGRMENPLERGICEINGDLTPVITINEEAWQKMDENEREPLMFHELGHCVLHRKHKTGQISPGVPESLMNPYTIPDYTYAAYQDHYIKELYKQKNDF
jgi:hypothetical protein